MSVVNHKNIDEFRGWYEQNYGHVDDVSHIFGWATYEKFYGEMRFWEQFIRSAMSFWIFDIIPLSWVKWALLTIIGSIHDNGAADNYFKGVDMGRKIVGRVEEVIAWAQNQIDTAVDAAKAYIKTNLIDPLNNYINNNLKPRLADAEARMNAMLNQLSGFDTRIQGLAGSVDSMTNSIKNFDSKLQSYETSLSNLTSKAQALDTNLKDAQTRITDAFANIGTLNQTANKLTSDLKTVQDRINSAFGSIDSLNASVNNINANLKAAQDSLAKYKELIDALDKRVAILEGKPAPTTPTGLPTFPSIIPDKIPDFLKW